MKSFAGSIIGIFLMLTFINGCATMESRWEEAKRKDTISSYQMFLSQYPHGKFSEEARSRLYLLNLQRLYEQALKTSRYWLWDEFLKENPNKEFLAKAQKHIDTFTIETIKEPKKFSWADLGIQEGEAEVVFEVRGTARRPDTITGNRAIEYILEELYGTQKHTLLKETAPPFMNLARNVLHAQISIGYGTNEFTLIPNDPSEFMMIIKLRGLTKEIYPEEMTRISRAGIEFFRRLDNKQKEQILKKMRVVLDPNLKKGFVFNSVYAKTEIVSYLGRTIREISGAYGRLRLPNALLFWLTISSEIKEEALKAKAYIQLFDCSSIVTFAQKWSIGLRGFLYFDPINWVPFLGGMDCKGGAVLLQEDGVTILPTTSIAFKKPS